MFQWPRLGAEGPPTLALCFWEEVLVCLLGGSSIRLSQFSLSLPQPLLALFWTDLPGSVWGGTDLGLSPAKRGSPAPSSSPQAQMLPEDQQVTAAAVSAHFRFRDAVEVSNPALSVIKWPSMLIPLILPLFSILIKTYRIGKINR